MRKKDVKKMFAALLATSMMIGMLSGCGSTETAADKTDDTASAKVEETKEETKEDTAEETKEDTAEETKEDVADSTEPTVITALTSKESYCGDWNNHRWVEMIEEELNVDLQIELVPEDVWSEKSALFFASNELPDIIWGNIDAPLYGNQGYLLDMKEYVSEEATPNIWNAWQTYPDLKKACTELNGAIYELRGYSANPSALVRQKMWINKTWSQEILGKDCPETLDEFYTFCKEVRDRDMDGDGDTEDEYGFGGRYDPYPQLHLRNLVVNAMGFAVDNRWMEISEDGKTAVYVPATEEYKEVLKFMHTMWEEGFMDPEYFTMDDDQKYARIATGDWGSYGQWGPDLVNLKQEDWSIFYPMTSEFNDTPIVAGGSVRTVGRVCLSATTENPEICMKILDWMMDQEHCNILTGILEFDSDPQWPGYGHKWEYSEEIDGEAWVWYGPDGKNDYPEGYGGESQPGFGQFEIAPSYEQIPSYDGDPEEYVAPGNFLGVETLKMSPYLKTIFPSVKFSAEEENERALIFADLDPYFQEMETRMITGDLDIEADWDSYIQGLKDRGLDRYLEMYQNGLDKWNAS